MILHDAIDGDVAQGCVVGHSSCRPVLAIVDEEPFGGTHEDVFATVLTKCVDLNSP